jgi:acetyl esterase/lipase
MQALSASLATAAGGAAVAMAASRYANVTELLKATKGANNPKFVFDQPSEHERARVDLAIMALVTAGEFGIGVLTPGVAFRILSELVSGKNSLGIKYGAEHDRQVLDLFEPLDPPASPVLDACVFVHGGAWCWGERFHFATVGRTLADELGCSAVVPTYRSYPHGDVEEMVSDVIRCFCWTVDYATMRCTTPRVVVMGHSAGAALTLLALARLASKAAGATEALGKATRPCPLSAPTTTSADSPGDRLVEPAADWELSWLSPARASHVLRCISACISLSGVADITRHYTHEASRTLELPLGLSIGGLATVSPMAPAHRGRRLFPALSPAPQLRALPPSAARLFPTVALVHGTEDATVPESSSLDLMDALCSIAVPAACHILPGADHMSTILPLISPDLDVEVRLAKSALPVSARALLLGLIREAAEPQRARPSKL